MDKQCTKCKAIKPLSEFVKASEKKSGYASSCSDCMSKARGAKRRCKPPQLALTQEQVCYLAGLIDGEGCINLSRLRHRTYNTYNARLTIGMCTNVLFDLCREYGIGYMMVKSRRDNGWKECVIWTIGANACRALLPLVLPYLRVKKRQAELLLQYLDYAQHRINRTEGGREQHAARAQAIYDELAALNRRGKEANPSK